MYKNLWLREARAGFSSQRGAAIERRRVGVFHLPIFSSGVLCLELFFFFFKEIELKADALIVENLRLNGAT